MKRHVAALVLFVAAAVSSPAQQPKQTIPKADVLQAIADFRAEPESARGNGAASVIVRFAQDSPDVTVSGSPALQPWMAPKPPPKQSRTLLVAYIAGSVRSQLESGKTKDDTLAGEEQVIETYQKIQQTTPDLHIAEVEKLVALQKQGKLKEYLDSK
jgi:hypothetical protein